MGKKEKTLTILFLAIAGLLLGALTYGYLSAGVSNANKEVASITSGTLELVFDDADSGINAKLNLGETVHKTFTIENTGSLDATAHMYFENYVNEYTFGSLSYEVKYKTSASGTYTSLGTTTMFRGTYSNLILIGDLMVPAGATYYYDVAITFNNLANIDQTADVNAKFVTSFKIDTEYIPANINLSASEATYAGWQYSGSTIKKYTGTDTNVIMPTSINGVNITAIYDDASLFSEGTFYNNTNIKRAVIGNKITSIGEFAFFNCTSLQSITIPDSVTSIADSAFNGCSSLQSITIPDSVTSIAGSAFRGCSSLQSIIIGRGVTSIGMEAFYGLTPSDVGTKIINNSSVNLNNWYYFLFD